jgi:hypothetical protein
MPGQYGQEKSDHEKGKCASDHEIASRNRRATHPLLAVHASVVRLEREELLAGEADPVRLRLVRGRERGHRRLLLLRAQLRADPPRERRRCEERGDGVRDAARERSGKEIEKAGTSVKHTQ